MSWACSCGLTPHHKLNQKLNQRSCDHYVQWHITYIYGRRRSTHNETSRRRKSSAWGAGSWRYDFEYKRPRYWFALRTPNIHVYAHGLALRTSYYISGRFMQSCISHASQSRTLWKKGIIFLGESGIFADGHCCVRGRALACAKHRAYCQ